jgi:hypothetical protein
MNAPVRLLESSRNPRARRLLQAGLGERPRPAALRSTALVLGISTTALAVSTTATASAGAAATIAASPLMGPSLAVIATKWLTIGTFCGLALAGSAAAVSDLTSATGTGRPRPLQQATRQPVHGLRPVSSSVMPALPSATSEAAHVQPERLSQSTPAAPRAEKRARSPESRAVVTTPALPASARLPDGQSLSKEIALIDGARRALSTGDAATTLRQLDEYTAAPRTGTLDREAQLLRIDALARSGQRAAALELAEHYLTSYPNDPHAARLRTLTAAP